MDQVKIYPVGETSLQVEFENRISLEINQKVKCLFDKIRDDHLDGILEVVPSYCTLLIYYDPLVRDYAKLRADLEDIIFAMPDKISSKEEIIEIPVCYDEEFGPDLPYVAKMEGRSEEEIVRIHTSHLSYIYLLGFSPGHAYSARFEEPFAVKRSATPKISIPPRSIVVVEEKTNVIPFEQPTGWHVIGSTPVLQTDFRKSHPFLFHAGQWISFKEVDSYTYKEIKALADAGEYHCRIYEREEGQ